MLSKSHLKLVQALKQNKFRKQKSLFIAEGPKVVGELILSQFKVHTLFATSDYNSSVLPDDIEVITVSLKELERISLLKSPHQVIGIFHMEKINNSNLPPVNDLTLVLDDIRDPGNMGTIIRTADWYGIRHLICSENCVDIYNPKVVQSTMGSLARIDVFYTNLETYLAELPLNTPTYGAVMGQSSVYEISLSSNAVLVIGNESHGISQNLLNQLKYKISIPPFSKTGQTGPESLNASVAAAILCSEFRRQNK